MASKGDKYKLDGTVYSVRSICNNGRKAKLQKPKQKRNFKKVKVERLIEKVEK